MINQNTTTSRTRDNHSAIVTGVFLLREKAEAAVSDLYAAGFDSSAIGIASRNDDGGWGQYVGTDRNAESMGIGEGMAAGAATGAGLGGLWALGIVAGVLPAIGPVVAGGILGSILASAAGGATTGALAGGILGALDELGMPEEDARYYDKEFNAGRTIVTVRAEDRAGEAQAILAAHGASTNKKTARV